MTRSKDFFGAPVRTSTRDSDKITKQSTRDISDAIGSLPEVEYVEMEIVDGDYPILVDTGLRDVKSVTVAQVLDLDTPTEVAYATAVSWDIGGESGEMRIRGIDNLTTGTRYQVRLRIEGGR